MPLTKSATAILFVHYGDDWIRGSERCLLDLLTHLDRAQYTPVVWCNSDKMAQQVRQLHIEVVCQPFPLLLGWSAPRLDFLGFWQLLRQACDLIEQHSIGLIHSNSGAPCQWLNIVARRFRLPLVAHLHCRYPLRDRLTFGLHHLSRILAVSQPVAQQYLGDSLASNRVFVISNGIDKQRVNANAPLSIRELLGLSASDLVLVSAGSLIERKGMDILIDALDLVRQQGVPAKLVIIGEGCCHSQLVQQIARLKLTRQVFLLGERTDLARLLAGGVDVFLSGAREEVFGLVLAEAGLLALPVIAPAVGGIPEVVVHNHSGLLVPPNAPVHTAQAISLLYRQPELRQRLGLTAKARIEQLFLIQRNVQAVESCYRQMLNHPAHQLCWFSHWSPTVAISTIIKFVRNKLSASPFQFKQRKD